MITLVQFFNFSQANGLPVFPTRQMFLAFFATGISVAFMKSPEKWLFIVCKFHIGKENNQSHLDNRLKVHHKSLIEIFNLNLHFGSRIFQSFP